MYLCIFVKGTFFCMVNIHNLFRMRRNIIIISACVLTALLAVTGCWAITKGSIEGRLLEFTVVIVAEIWTPGGIVEGSADIERLLMACLGIANDVGFAGHRLGGAEFHLGISSESDYGDGVQPHPLYQAQIKLQFTAPIRRLFQ